MKYQLAHIVAAAAMLFAASACEDTTSNIGSSLVNDDVKIVIDSAFTANGRSVAIQSIRPKTVTQILGKIDVPEYGRLSSSVVSQFLPSTELDTANFVPSDVDSLILTLRYDNGSFIGDSVAPMGVNVYALTKQLPAGIASDFDPEGYYNPSKPLASIIYNATSLGSDSIAKLTYRDIRLKLPRELGRELFQKFVDNPSSYANGKTFANEVFPGIYIRNSFGAGRLTMVSQTFMSMHLRHIGMNETTEKLDTTDAVHQYFLVTPEVLNNNNLSINLASTLTEKIKEGKSLLVAPAGYEVEFDFPTREMVAAFRSHKDGVAVVNGVSMNLPVDTIKNDFKVSPPPYALMVLKKDRDAFFAENKLPDGKTSFYAAYDASNNRYHFGALRSYILEMLDKEEITDEDCNFCLVPVQVNFENLADSGYGGTQQTESEVLPYLISPAMCELRFDKAKIKITYSLQTQK